jgi:hypothetical protein
VAVVLLIWARDLDAALRPALEAAAIALAKLKEKAKSDAEAQKEIEKLKKK